MGGVGLICDGDLGGKGFGLVYLCNWMV